jgi:hypothetical protein
MLTLCDMLTRSKRGSCVHACTPAGFHATFSLRGHLFLGGGHAGAQDILARLVQEDAGRWNRLIETVAGWQEGPTSADESLGKQPGGAADPCMSEFGADGVADCDQPQWHKCPWRKGDGGMDGQAAQCEGAIAAPSNCNERRSQLWIVVAEDAAATAAVLYRHAPLFRVVSVSDDLRQAPESKQGARQRPHQDLRSEALHDRIRDDDVARDGAWHAKAEAAIVEAGSDVADVCVLTGSLVDRDQDQDRDQARNTARGGGGGGVEGVAHRLGRSWVCRPRRASLRQPASHASLLHPLSESEGSVLDEGSGGEGEGEGGRGHYSEDVRQPAADDVGGSTEVSYVMPRLYGLLGNVLFQTAAALTLAWHLDHVRLHGRRWVAGICLCGLPRPCLCAPALAGVKQCGLWVVM